MSDHRSLQLTDLPSGDSVYQTVSIPWRSIESAPKNGQKILATFVDPESQYWPSVAYWMNTPGHEQWAGFTLDEQPTHWMPLPEPPNKD